GQVVHNGELQPTRRLHASHHRERLLGQWRKRLRLLLDYRHRQGERKGWWCHPVGRPVVWHHFSNPTRWPRPIRSERTVLTPEDSENRTVAGKPVQRTSSRLPPSANPDGCARAG